MLESYLWRGNFKEILQKKKQPSAPLPRYWQFLIFSRLPTGTPLNDTPMNCPQLALQRVLRRRRPMRPRRRHNSKRSSGNAADVRPVTSRTGNNALEANGKTVAVCKLRTDMATSKHQEVEVLDNWEDIEDSDVSEAVVRW